MATIICTRPNASELINGVVFVRQEDGSVIAHDVLDDVALAFTEIPGYELVGEKAVEAPAVEAAVEPAVEAPPPRRGRPPRDA